MMVPKSVGRITQPLAGEFVLWFVELYEGDPKGLADLIPDINEPLRRNTTLDGQNVIQRMTCR